MKKDRTKRENVVKSENAHFQRVSSHHVLPFWLLVASLVRGAAMLLMHCPYYQYTGAHFADLERMTG